MSDFSHGSKHVCLEACSENNKGLFKANDLDVAVCKNRKFWPHEVKLGPISICQTTNQLLACHRGNAIIGEIKNKRLESCCKDETRDKYLPSEACMKFKMYSGGWAFIGPCDVEWRDATEEEIAEFNRQSSKESKENLPGLFKD